VAVKVTLERVIDWSKVDGSYFKGNMKYQFDGSSGHSLYKMLL
jgi:hypothetical protein